MAVRVSSDSGDIQRKKGRVDCARPLLREEAAPERQPDLVLILLQPSTRRRRPRWPDQDGLSSEGDVVVARRVAAPRLTVVGLSGAVPDGSVAHRESHLRCSRSGSDEPSRVEALFPLPRNFVPTGSNAAARAVLFMSATAFASNAAIGGDWSETIPTLFPFPSTKFTFAVEYSRLRMTGAPAPGNMTDDYR